MTIESHLENFRINFPFHKVTVEEDYLIYRVSRGTAKRAATEANELIEKLGSPLVAIPTELWSNDTFCVKSIETIDI